MANIEYQSLTVSHELHESDFKPWQASTLNLEPRTLNLEPCLPAGRLEPNNRQDRAIYLIPRLRS